MKLQRIANVTFLVLTAWLLLTSALKAATLEESAKIEGEVVLYSSLNNEQIVTLVDAFKKKYPAINHPSTAPPASAFCSGRSPKLGPVDLPWTL